MKFVYKSRFKEDYTTDLDLYDYDKDTIQILFSDAQGGNYPTISKKDGKISDILKFGLPKLEKIATGKTSEGVSINIEKIEIKDKNIENYSFPDVPKAEEDTNPIIYIVTNAIYHDPSHFFITDETRLKSIKIYNDLMELRCKKIKEKAITKQSLWAITYLSLNKMDIKPKS